MRRWFFYLALLMAAFSAHALESLRVGSQVLSVGDSAARVKALLGNPSAKVSGSSQSGARKGASKSSGKGKGKKAGAQNKGVQ
ncbi:MAG TPA: hypothetical protein VL997_08355, partial [Dyella sp.]|nr:hypothetical protein [Dyella sp.]